MSGSCDIANAVGITRAGLLHHFGSKELLLWAILEERDRRGDRLAQPFIGAGGRAFIDAMLPIMEEDREERVLVQLYVLLVAENVPDSRPAHEHFATRYATLGRRALQLPTAGQTDGEIRPGVDLAVVEPLLGAVIEGLLLRWLYQPEAVDLVASYRVFAAAMKARQPRRPQEAAPEMKLLMPELIVRESTRPVAPFELTALNGVEPAVSARD